MECSGRSGGSRPDGWPAPCSRSPSGRTALTRERRWHGVTERLNRAALVIGAAAVVSSLLGIPGSTQFRLARIGGGTAVVLIGLGVLAIIGARLGRRPLVAIAGVGLLAAAGLQLAQLGRSTNWLGGDGSTFGLLLGIGLGLTVLGLVPLPTEPIPFGDERQ